MHPESNRPPAWQLAGVVALFFFAAGLGKLFLPDDKVLGMPIWAWSTVLAWIIFIGITFIEPVQSWRDRRKSPR